MRDWHDDGEAFHVYTQQQEQAMKIKDMMPSKYLTQDDIGEGKLVTVARFEQHNVAMQGQPPEMKWIIHFSEMPKPMVLNPTNITLAAQALGSEETNDWVGRKLVLYVDPTVSMGGKLVGGIRVRAPRGQAANQLNRTVSAPVQHEIPVESREFVQSYQATEQAQARRGPIEEIDEDIPF